MNKKKEDCTQYPELPMVAEPIDYTWEEMDYANKRDAVYGVILDALVIAGGAYSDEDENVAEKITFSVMEKFFPRDHVFTLNVRVSGSTTLKGAYAKLLHGMTESKLDWMSETAWDHHGNEVSEEALQAAAVAALEDAQKEEA